MADNRPGQNVHFEDTFSIPDEREVWTRHSLPPQPARPREQVGLREVNPAWVGGDRHNPARSSSWPNYTVPGTSANLSRSGLYHSRDIGQIVRKWQIRFSGAKSQSIDVFLARLEDCRVLANLTEEEVLSLLSELFTDTAATWYRNEKEKWLTWQDFLTVARRWYGTTKRYQQRLIAEANNHTQGEDEAVRDYITCLIAIIRKISPPSAGSAPSEPSVTTIGYGSEGGVRFSRGAVRAGGGRGADGGEFQDVYAPATANSRHITGDGVQSNPETRPAAKIQRHERWESGRCGR